MKEKAKFYLLSIALTATPDGSPADVWKKLTSKPVRIRPRIPRNCERLSTLLQRMGMKYERAIAVETEVVAQVGDWMTDIDTLVTGNMNVDMPEGEIELELFFFRPREGKCASVTISAGPRRA